MKRGVVKQPKREINNFARLEVGPAHRCDLDDTYAGN